MKYSVIIPYHSNWNLLSACLDSLIKTVPEDTEIIVVANCENPHALVRQIPDRCTVLEFNRPLYYPCAVNIGAKQACGEYIILVDADIFVNAGWLEALTACFENHADVGGCSAKMLDPYHGRVKEFGIGFTGYNFPHPFAGRMATDTLVSSDREVQAFCSAASMYRRTTYLELGGMDEGLVDGYSDIDLCLRLHESGLHTYVAANAVVYHHGSSTFGSGMSAHLRADTKGYFMARGGNRCQVDMNAYFETAFQQYGLPLQPKYFLVDFTTIANRQWHYDLLSKLGGFCWSDILRRPIGKRGAVHIPLYTLLDDNIRRHPQPICCFIDDFLALQNNSIWKELRPNREDLAIDRNANIFPLLDVV